MIPPLLIVIEPINFGSFSKRRSNRWFHIWSRFSRDPFIVERSVMQWGP